MINVPVTNRFSKSTARILAAAKNIYDVRFKNDGEATLGGIFILVVPILFTLLCVYNFSLVNDRATFITILVTGACVIRLVVARWIYMLAKELNRKSTNWIMLSLLIPGITLTLIGARRKIKDVNDYKKYVWVPRIKQILSPVLTKLKTGLIK